MSLNKDTLKNGLITVFNQMNLRSSGGIEYFASQVSQQVADYIKSGSVTTTDSGSISAGSFTGSGTGSVKADFSTCEAVLLAALYAMMQMPVGGDDYLATELARGIHTMATESKKVETSVTGTATSGTTVTPVTGTAKGEFSGTQSTLRSAFIAAFTAMGGMYAGGNEYLADEIAKAVTTYLKNGTISTQGEGVLSGSSGSGSIS